MKGKTDEIIGRIKEATGSMTGNTKLRDRGRAEQALGRVEQAAEKGVKKAKKVADGMVDRAKVAAQKEVDKAKKKSS